MKRSNIERFLPEVFQRTIRPGTPLFSILEVMESLNKPSEEVLEHLNTFLNPYHTPDRFVPMLASWVNLDRILMDDLGEFTSLTSPNLPAGLGWLRELIVNAAYLSKWRGTAKGLLLFLETATGTQGFQIDKEVSDLNSKSRPFHLCIRAPNETRQYRALIERIIEMEKPAYVTYDLEFVE
jgi:phage tail-like protein